MINNGYTPTHRRILELLGDGLAHTPEELHSCLYDELAEMKTIGFHLGTLRKKLRERGRGILLEVVNGKSYYRLVQYLARDE